MTILNNPRLIYYAQTKIRISQRSVQLNKKILSFHQNLQLLIRKEYFKRNTMYPVCLDNSPESLYFTNFQVYYDVSSSKYTSIFIITKKMYIFHFRCMIVRLRLKEITKSELFPKSGCTELEKIGFKLSLKKKPKGPLLVRSHF